MQPAVQKTPTYKTVLHFIYATHDQQLKWCSMELKIETLFHGIKN